MIKINLFDLRRENSLRIYRSIHRGKDALYSIAKETGISLLTVCELANILVAREILEIEKPKQNRVGRPRHKFTPSHKYYCIFIDKQKEFFSTIGISTNGSAIERFDYPLNFEKRSCQEVIEIVLNRVYENPHYKYCMAIYLLGDDNEELNVPDNVIRTTKEHLIATSLADESKIRLFEFDGEKCILSLYSHLQYPKVSKDEICKIIKIDELYTFSGNLFFESFEALQKIAIINLENII